MIIMTNFMRDLDDLVASSLREQGFQPDRIDSAFGRFAALADRASRSIPQQIYKVFESHELRSNKDYATWKVMLDEIRRRAEAGQSLTPYVSRNVTRPGGRNDILFSSWGINHLHLNRIQTSDEFGHVARSDFLLFVKVTADAVYFLDVQRHKGNVFVQRRLLEILGSNWPELLPEIPGLSGERELTDVEMHSLMKSGYSFAVKVKGKTVMPDLGISTAGIRLLNTIEYMRYARQLKLLDRQIRREFPRFFGKLSQHISHVKLLGIDTRECRVIETFSSTVRIVTFA